MLSLEEMVPRPSGGFCKHEHPSTSWSLKEESRLDSILGFIKKTGRNGAANSSPEDSGIQ
jgi:hypothetical protein